MVGGGRESKTDRSLSKFPMLTTESGWPTENGQNPKILARQDSVMPPRKQWGMDRI
jgi:hypothetical protein